MNSPPGPLSLVNSPPGPLSLKREGEKVEAFFHIFCEMLNVQCSIVHEIALEGRNEHSPGLHPGVEIGGSP